MLLADLTTPALLLDLAVLERNCAAMDARAQACGVRLRPHLKTAKSASVAAIATWGQFGGITVSTVAEAAYFASHGYRDLTYAVGVAAGKIPALATIVRETGAVIHLIADDAGLIRAAEKAAAVNGVSFPILIELDTGGGRGGVSPEDADLVALATTVARSRTLRLAGVLTHAGHSYHAHGIDEIQRIAEDERAGAVLAAERLRAAGLPCETVSVGSTPTVVHGRSLAGVTEIRPGVYTFFDLQQAALGVCTEADIALSVLATVIGHNRRSQRILIDAGALALSKDVSAGEFRANVGYGLIRPVRGGSLPADNLFVAEVHQEHGLIAAPDGGELPWDALPVGATVRVLPNHACLTAAAFDRYHVDRGDGLAGLVWTKAVGW